MHPLARRVCLPKQLAAPLGLVPGERALVRLSPWRDGELVVTVADKGARTGSRRDPDRPRLVTARSQVSLPSVLLEMVGVTAQNPWVYFAPEDLGLGVRVIPAVRVRAQVSAASPKQVQT